MRGFLSLLSPRGPRARLLIFTYHRVLSSPDPLLPDEPYAESFAQQLDWLAEFCRVLPLSEAVRALRAGTLPDRAACITFDDGYANNHDVAMPLLQARGLTATVFVTTGAVEQGVMWNDLVIEALRATCGRTLHGEEATRAVAQALEKLKYLPLQERWEAAVELYLRDVGQRLPRLMMTPEQVQAMAAAGFEIGAHTVNHAILKTLTEDQARREIEGSRDWLHDVLGHAPRAFAYPNGRPGRDYDAVHARLVREAGFESAVSTSWSCVTRRSDVFQLPRVTLWDRTRGRFWLRLAQSYLTSYVS